MHRLTILALLLVPLLIAAALPQAKYAAATPLIQFSFYAPAQPDSPVRILGFEHDESDARLVLSNASDKPVVGVIIDIASMVPSGCALERRRDDMDFMSIGGASYELLIAPHGKAVGSRIGVFRLDEEPPQTASYPHLTGVTPQGAAYAHYPKAAVLGARDAKAGYMQVQFGVTGVFFEDGTTWPVHLSSVGLPAHPFAPTLVEDKGWKCADAASVANALASVKEVVFDHESPQASNNDDGGGPPHLRFSCSLEGPKAICRLPLENVHSQ
jgi:hypothetical protein